MPLALELGLDADAEREVRAVWDGLEQVGVPSLATHAFPIRPHVTLAVSEDVPGMRRAAAWLRRLVEPVAVELVGPALFPAEPAILHLAVGPTQALLAMHRRVLEAVDEERVEVWPHYRVGTWLPHCTLSMGVPAEHLGDALMVCLGAPLPIGVTLSEPMLTDSETGDTSPL